MLSYKTFGSQRSDDWVVLVHGAGGSSAVWFKQIREFQKRFNVLLIDLRGHGRSQAYHGDGGKYTVDAIGRDIIEVLDREGIDAAHFIGVSLGTIFIRAIVELAPRRVKSAIYAGAVSGFTAWARILILAGQVLKYVIPFQTLYGTFAWIIMPGKKAREARRVFIAESKRVSPEEFSRWLRLIPEVSRRLREWATRISDCRSLYVMGSRDYMFLPPARMSVERSANSFLEVIEGVGHVCNIERPQRFNEIVISFLLGEKKSRREASTSSASR